jgi:hypothetical protein
MTMRKFILSAALALAVAGCATSPYGNFLGETASVDQHQLAGEAVKRLVSLYPPAKMRFELQQATADVFGTALVKGLRERGYAVLELDPKAASSASKAQKEAALVQPAPSAAQTLPLRYVVDQAGGANLYRLTLIVGEQTITRPYLYQDGALAAAGYWARKEQAE